MSFDADGQPRAFTLYKRTDRGLKSSASGSDGSLDGRDTVKDMIPRKFRTPGVYGEVSGAVERVVQRARVPAVCTTYVPEVIHKRIEPMPDGLHYAREITGIGRHVKVLVGRPRGIPTTTLEAPACPLPLANPRRRGPAGRRNPDREALLRELAECEAKISDAYWRFTRQARAKPPVMVVPEAYRRRAEIERLLGRR